MNAERLEIARRLVACPKWVWLPGMQYMDPDGDVCMPDRVHHVEILRSAWAIDEPFIFFSDDPADFICARLLVPDLDDDLTRIGVLAVVRLAHGNPLLCTYPVKMADCEPWWNVGVPWSRESGGVFCATARTEVAALADALEAAR